MLLLSGDQVGKPSLLPFSVRRLALEPSAFMTQISQFLAPLPEDIKAIRLPSGETAGAVSDDSPLTFFSPPPLAPIINIPQSPLGRQPLATIRPSGKAAGYSPLKPTEKGFSPCWLPT